MFTSVYKRLIAHPILKSLFISASGTGMAQLFMLVNQFLIARYLAPEGFGLYTASYAICTLTSFLFNWGLDTWLLRQASLEERPKEIAGGVIAIKLLFGVVWAALLIFLLPFIQPQTYLRPLIAVCVVDILCDGLFTAQIAFLNSQNRFSHATTFLNLSRGGRLLFAVLLLLFGARNPLFFAGARFSATLIGLFVLTLWARPVIHVRAFGNITRVFFSSIPYGISDLLTTIYLQADVSILAVITGSSKAVGIYSPASGLVNALFIIPNAAFYVFLPNLVRRLQNNTVKGTHFIEKMMIGFVALGIGMWVATRWLGQPVMVLVLGKAYAESGQLLALLSPLLFMKSVEFGCTSVIIATGLQKYRLFPQSISALMNIVLNVIFIPLYGVRSVANNYLISEVILFFGYLAIAIYWMIGYLRHPTGETGGPDARVMNSDIR